jgi:hypothetical protein
MIVAAQQQALIRAISPNRLQTYTAAAASTSADVLDLYVWDRDLAAAAMADIAILEVAMRNAMNGALERLAGRPDWYAVDIGLDNRSKKSVTKAWGQVPAGRRVPGRVVAQLMFGFWRDLLEAGGAIGEGPLQTTAVYEDLWRRQIRTAFPGGRAIARAEGASFTRPWTLAVVKEVHALRNRAAHHEPLVNGLPMPGENRRLTALQGHQACLKLAAILDRHLASWMVSSSHMARVLPTRP